MTDDRCKLRQAIARQRLVEHRWSTRQLLSIHASGEESSRPEIDLRPSQIMTSSRPRLRRALDSAAEERHLIGMNHDPGPGEPMIFRARKIAAGFADVGLTHAEEMLRRLSPEGREQARRERAAKARRQKRFMLRLVMAAIAALLAWALLATVSAPGVALAAASAVLLLLTALVLIQTDRPVPGGEALVEAPLHRLAEESIVWLAAQRRGLPLPAAQLADSMNRRLDALAPRLGRLDPRSPTATAVRKLIAEEMPRLVDGWRAVPISARRAPGADGRTPDDHLINGLRLIEAELGQASEQIGRGSIDEIEVFGRYLELKYDEDGRLMRR